MLVELVRFFSDVKIHDHATYFVDSLWEYTDVLRVSVRMPHSRSSAGTPGCSLPTGLGSNDVAPAGRQMWHRPD